MSVSHVAAPLREKLMEELLTGMLLRKIMIFNMQHLFGFKHIYNIYTLILILRMHDTSININKY